MFPAACRLRAVLVSFVALLVPAAGALPAAGAMPAVGAMPAAGEAAQAPQAPVRVGGNIQAPKKIKDVRPVYPQEARDAKVQGVVIIEVTINPSGLVSDARVLRSVKLLDAAALEAVRQWEFVPTLLNGEPVSIIMSVTVSFTLEADK